ncbi:hypothetical protein [Fontivita pretiosa]|uniref:hypothetical protein n=1 Tax=Fontivita pretiosa TaxID=2989684 RepID=UPI003D168A16
MSATELKDNELARRQGDAVICRPQPLRLRWVFDQLATADAHTLEARFAASVRIADTDADRKMFSELLLCDRQSVTAQMLIEHFAPPLRAALTGLAMRCRAADVVGNPDQQHTWIAELLQAARPAAFAAGLELLPPYQLDLQSPTLQRQRIQELARAQAEQHAAGQLQHLQRAAELLQQFQQMRQAAPQLSAGALLERLNPADRGPTLQALLLASGSETRLHRQTLWCVAGGTLVRIDPGNSPQPELIQLPATLGPLRSVQPAVVNEQRVLLIGAQGGVMVVSREDPERIIESFACPSLQSQHGFNRVVVIDDTICASHAEAGIVRWSRDRHDAPTACYAERDPDSQLVAQGTTITQGASSGMGMTSIQARLTGPRHLQALDQTHLIYAVGSRIILRHDDRAVVLPSHSDAEIIAILPTSAQHMLAIHQDGTIVSIDRTTRQVSVSMRRPGRFTAAATMPWLGDVRVLLATDDGPIDCIGLDDPLLSEYLSPYRGLKILAATASLIAAVTPDRQRVVLWQAWETQRPLCEVHVTGRARHRIADIDFDA